MLSRTSIYNILYIYRCVRWWSATLTIRHDCTNALKTSANKPEKKLNWKEKYHGGMKRQKRQDRKKKNRELHTTHTAYIYIESECQAHTQIKRQFDRKLK